MMRQLVGIVVDDLNAPLPLVGYSDGQSDQLSNAAPWWGAGQLVLDQATLDYRCDGQ